jgi:antibiotic biosynthesis monooxygenase (ABM) superfamily enzyme
MKEALPQMLFIAVLLINLCTSLINSNRNFKASLIATIVLLTLTYWGGFFIPLLNFLK